MADLIDITSNKDILNIAKAVKRVTRTTGGISIPEMPERLLDIRAVEKKEVSVILNTEDLKVSLGMYDPAIKHLFVATPATNEDAILIQRSKPKIALEYNEVTGELFLSFESVGTDEIKILVVDLLLAQDGVSQGFLIMQGSQSGETSIDAYSFERAYESGDLFLYNKGTAEAPVYVLGITVVTHEAEAFDPTHNTILATQFNKDGSYVDIADLLSMISTQDNQFTTTLKNKVGGVNGVQPTEESDKIIIDAKDIKTDKAVAESNTIAQELETKVVKIDGKGLSTNDYDNTEKQKVADNTVNRHTHSNKALLDTYTQTDANILDAITKKHSHSNKATLDATQESFTTLLKNKVDAIEPGAQTNIIEDIKVNGISQTIADKAVNITTPTKISDLQDTTDITPIARAAKDSEGGVIKDKYTQVAHVVNDLMSTETDKPLSALQGKILKELLDSKELGKAYGTIEDMVNDLNAKSIDEYRVAFNLLIVQLNVPDFWVVAQSVTHVPYTYSTDQALLDAVQIAPLQIGHYTISLLETAKVDLLNYVQKSLKIAGIGLEQDITKAELQEALDFNTKVDKVEGKGLSTNDYTSTEKSKLAGIEAGANKYILPADVVQDANYVHTDNNFTITDKTKLAGLENYDDTAITSALANKVDKVTGKQLSTEDYTSTEKSKLAGIAAGAQVNTITSVAGRTGTVTLTKADVGLGNVTNEAQATKVEFNTHILDSVKHITSAERTSWNNKADKATTLAGYGITDSISQAQLENTSFNDLKRINVRGYTGGAWWYYPLADFPADNSSNDASLIVLGRIGGWTKNDMSFVNAILSNRGGDYGNLINLGLNENGLAMCRLQLYRQSNNTSKLYLAVRNYFAFDINVNAYSGTPAYVPTVTYDGSYVTSPSGTLGWDSYTTNSSLKVYNGVLTTNGASLGGTTTITGTLII